MHRRYDTGVYAVFLIGSGSVANSKKRGVGDVGARWELCSDPEGCVDELTLRYRITPSDPADLTLAGCVHRFVPFDRSTCTLHGSESEDRHDPLLNEPMILLDDVVQIRRRSAATR
jgi:hypothetical protein